MHDETGIVHGDLFARNIMVDKETGNPRVIDFGRSKYFSTKNGAFHKMVREDIKNLDDIVEKIEEKIKIL